MAKTIADYQEDYEKARKAGDAEAMKTANDGANALRRQMGLAEEYATEDIANTAAGKNGAYTPINSYAAQMVDEDKFREEVAKQQRYIDENPTAATDHTREEYRRLYGEIYDNAPYTTPADRVVPEGESGADAGLMSSGDYAVVQYLKGVWAEGDANYKNALAAGNAEEAQYWLAQRDNAHLEAERIRANYGYSGGADGSMYMDYRFSALNRDTDGDDDHGGHGSGGTGGTGGTGGSIGGGVSLPQVQAEDFSRYLEELYAARTKAALAELEAAYQKNVAAFDRSEAGIAGAYQAARNQAAAVSEQAGRKFHEYAAANGLNSGTGGQAGLARGVALQNDLNAIHAAQASSVAELQTQRAQAEVEYNNAIAQAEAQGDHELAAALYEEKVRVQELLLDWEIQQQKLELQWYQAQTGAQMDEAELAFQQQKYAQTLAQQRQEAQNKVDQAQREALAGYGMAFLKQGVLPSDEMLAAMGMTKAQAQSYISSVLAGK